MSSAQSHITAIFSEPVHLHGVLGETKLASVLTCQSAQLDSNATPAECGLRYDTGQIISHWNMAENTNKSVLLDHTAVAQRKGECERASSNYYDTTREHLLRKWREALGGSGRIQAIADWERVNSADRPADNFQRIFLAEIADFREGLTGYAGERFFDQLIRDIPRSTRNGFSRSIIPNWGRTDHDDATKNRGNQTEVEGIHDSVAVVCRIVSERLNAEDGVGTYERRILYERRKLGRLGRPDGRKSNFYHNFVMYEHVELAAVQTHAQCQTSGAPRRSTTAIFDSRAQLYGRRSGVDMGAAPCNRPATVGLR
ncbi:hypothetical protein F5888DRAFT_1890407 [Russula emetica]|nr:hypothetical protein F5888DRAFT_1890407 [Russula emetica]